MASNKMISRTVIPAENLLFAINIYTHYEHGKGLKKLNEGERKSIEPRQSIDASPEELAAVNYAELLANTAPDPDNVFIDHDKTRDHLSDMMTYMELCREHCRALTEKGYGMKRSVLKKLDTIDISTLADYEHKDTRTMPNFPVMKTKEYVRHVFENCQRMDALMCMFVPPFTDFVYKLHRDRYMHVKIEEVSVEDLSMKMFVQDYTAQESLWVPGTKCQAEVTFSKNDIAFTNIKLYGECCNPHDINMWIDFSEMHWNKRQLSIWLNKDKEYTQKVMDMLAQQGTSSCLELMKYALMCNCVTNYMLHGNKPKIVREPKEKKESSAKTKEQANVQTHDNGKLPERRVRYIGTVKVTSTSIPRQATPDRVRHYKVAVWKAKGGIRHMKDGRVIPFKESIRYRHKLKDKVSEQDIAQVVLKLHDNSHIACENPDKDV